MYEQVLKFACFGDLLFAIPLDFPLSFFYLGLQSLVDFFSEEHLGFKFWLFFVVVFNSNEPNSKILLQAFQSVEIPTN